MKKNLTVWLWLLGLIFLFLALPQPCRAVVAQTSAQFNDVNDSGCHVTPGRAGSPDSGMSNPGGNQAHCLHCVQGMPSWWVDEPYINLWVADEPLSYTTSSGQEMTFRWTYKQRGQLDPPWTSRERDALTYSYASTPHVMMRYASDTLLSITNAGGVPVVQPGSSWQHNWWQEITFWDPYLETNIASPALTIERDINYNPTNVFMGFTGNYQGLLFGGDGGAIHFDINNSTAATASGQVKVQVLNPSSSGGPRIPYSYEDGYTGAEDTPYPVSGAFFVTNATYGFKVLFPDGSQDIYGLVLWHKNLTNYNGLNYGPPPKQPRVSTASAYLTERIDPEGRATLIGYEPKFHNAYNVLSGDLDATDFNGYDVKYVVDSDGRTNTYAYTDMDAGYIYPDYFKNTGLLLASITDPYGRTAQFTTAWNCGPTEITDAQGLTSDFSYDNGESISNAWLTTLTTPYGPSSFSYYQLQASGDTNQYEQRAAYVLGRTDRSSFIITSIRPPTGCPPPPAPRPTCPDRRSTMARVAPVLRPITP